jgi:Uncharacterized protein conserved in bacteria (DUF2171)
MINASQIKEHMEVMGSDGKHVGTVLGVVCAYGYGRPSVRDDHVFARKFFVEENAATSPSTGLRRVQR